MTFETAASMTAEGGAAGGPEVIGVEELCARLRDLVRGVPQPVFVRGEVCDLVRAPSGHVYFTLRGGGAQIACVLFRADAVKAPAGLREGASIVARANLDFYAARGQPQLVVRSVHARGLGDLWLDFEETRELLAREGLLDAARKRPLPAFPRRVGLVTSEAGEAMHDVVQILRRRNPLVDVILSPAIVQGEFAPESIIEALARLNARDDVDVIILARGGGSTEDLWAFNDELLARAIVASRLPVVAAVGHETDITIASLAADVRAPTPSAAAQLVAPSVEDLDKRIEAAKSALLREVGRVLEDALRQADGLGGVLAPETLAVVLRDAWRRLEAVRARLLDGAREFRRYREALDALQGRLDAVGPLETLRRGFAIVLADGEVVASVADVEVGDSLSLKLRDGDVECRVTKKTVR